METVESRSEIEKIYKVLEYLRTKLSHDGKECPIQKATIFLTVVLNEGITFGELAKVQGFNTSTISRNITELGFFKRKNKAGDYEDGGCGLVVSQPYEYHRREKVAYLSGAGKKIAKKIGEMLK